MDSLHFLVQQGKVLYLGVSDTPAWVVAAANEYSTSRGKTPQEIEMSEALKEVAKQHGDDVSITAVALAYVMHKAGRVFPICGGRKVEHLKDNIRSLELALTREQVEKLETTAPLDIGFPGNFIGDDSAVTGKTNPFIDNVAPISWSTGPKPLQES